MRISSKTLSFLKELSENNNREWFEENRAVYLASKLEMESFADSVLSKLSEFDVIETPSGKKSLFRIFRDVRFSKNKAPFKTNFGAHFKRAGANRRGGLGFRVDPNGAVISGGFWAPNPKDLLQIRHQLDLDPLPLRKVLEDPSLKDYFGGLVGSQLKTSPKGFPKDHADIDLLRYKQFILHHSFSIEEVKSEEFSSLVSEGFRKMYPFFDAMTDYLTTDLNGESII